MNRRPPGLQLEETIFGFINYKSAEGLSPLTIRSYQTDLNTWLEYQGNTPISKITTKNIRDYLLYMRHEYVPRRITGGNDRKLSGKTIRNIWITLSAFFRWASDEFKMENPMRGVAPPKYNDPPVEAFSKDQVEALIKACEYSEEADTVLRRKFRMRRATARRDKAIILVLLDTGLRASELCALRVSDVELQNGKVHVRHGTAGGAKGGKGRFVYLGKVARRAVWRYLAEREDGRDPEAPLIVSRANRHFNKDALRQLIRSLGEKAGVSKCYPHRFRHTFAITYLRSGGDVFTLQMLLGHSSLDMVKRYARVAEIDSERVHQKASPADNWRL